MIRERQRRPAVSFDEIAEFLGEGEHADAAGLPHAAINEGVAVAYECRYS